MLHNRRERERLVILTGWQIRHGEKTRRSFRSRGVREFRVATVSDRTARGPLAPNSFIDWDIETLEMR